MVTIKLSAVQSLSIFHGVLSISTVSFEVSIVLKTGSNLLGDLNNRREGHLLRRPELNVEADYL